MTFPRTGAAVPALGTDLGHHHGKPPLSVRCLSANRQPAQAIGYPVADFPANNLTIARSPLDKNLDKNVVFRDH